MSSKKNIKILLAGYGTVGKGICQLIHRCDERLDFPWTISIDKILVKNKTEDRMKEQENSTFVTSMDEFFNNSSDVDVVIEAIGGVTVAFDIISQALDRGISVVSANKDLIDQHWDTLQEKAKINQAHLRYEASVAGGIPIIHTINHGLLANRIEGLFAILNGTANYCLTQMLENDESLEEAIKEAQKKGYAESDPSSDIEGKDSAHKICILSRLCYETNLSYEDILTEGIASIEKDDLVFLRRHQLGVKLFGIARRFGDGIDLRVHPCYFSSKHPFESVRGVNNAVLIDADATGEVFLYGQGAGRYPTASAVVSDLFDVCANISQQTGHAEALLKESDKPLVSIDTVSMKYYLRFTVVDQQGVLSCITSILAQNKINVHIIEQSQCFENPQNAHIRIITDSCQEKDMQCSLLSIQEQANEQIIRRFVVIREAPWETKEEV